MDLSLAALPLLASLPDALVTPPLAGLLAGLTQPASTTLATLVAITGTGQPEEWLGRLGAKEDVKRITDEFLRFGMYIATGIASLAILAGFIMISTSHGSNARAENGRQAVLAGLVGLVGVALVASLVTIVTNIFPALGPASTP